MIDTEFEIETSHRIFIITFLTHCTLYLQER
jgi:hypothetical protein